MPRRPTLRPASAALIAACAHHAAPIHPADHHMTRTFRAPGGSEIEIEATWADLPESEPAAAAVRAWIAAQVFSGEEGSARYGDFDAMAAAWRALFVQAAGEDAVPGWFISRDASIAWVGPGLISVTAGWQSYTGGAHPNYASTAAMFDRATGDERTLASLFGGAIPDAVVAAAEEALRAELGVPAGESFEAHGLWFPDDRFVLPDDPWLDAGGLQLVYDPYEIAPYAAGSISVTVPWSALQDTIAPAARPGR